MSKLVLREGVLFAGRRCWLVVGPPGIICASVRRVSGRLPGVSNFAFCARSGRNGGGGNGRTEAQTAKKIRSIPREGKPFKH
eukprot:9148495-Pyramimonas_sp.AAC.1